MTPADLVAATLAELVPPGIRVGARLVSDGRPDRLLGDEVGHVAQAIDRRRQEFATGRTLLRELTGTSGAIGVLANRAPAPPPGWVVSLAHDRDLVAALVAPTTAARALGLDVEPVEPLDDGVIEIVLRTDDADIDPLAAFVAKEAVYKAWSSPERRILEFQDVRLRLGPGPGGFDAEVVAADAEPTTLTGRIARAGDRWLAVCLVD